jgi:hypothetical protein
MRLAFLCYLLKAWAADPHRPARRQAPVSPTPEGLTRHTTRPACPTAKTPVDRRSS